MQKSLFSLLLFASLLSFFSCEKNDTEMTDDELIAAIQEASTKQNISEAQLPAEAATILTSDFTESYLEMAVLVPELGYEVSMRRAEGTMMGERSNVYFAMDGRELRPVDRSGRRHPRRRGENGCDRIECFDFVYPITVIMPDGTTVSGESRQALRQAIRIWYQANGGPYERPELQFPLDIIFEADQSVLTVNSVEELRAAYQSCL
jgi:hypothetical protein